MDRDFSTEIDMITRIAKAMIRQMVRDGHSKEDAHALIGSSVMGVGMGCLIVARQREKPAYEWHEQVVAMINEKVAELPHLQQARELTA